MPLACVYHLESLNSAHMHQDTGKLSGVHVASVLTRARDQWLNIIHT